MLTADMVRRESGVLVPEALAGETDQGKPAGPPCTYLEDGRLRILMAEDDRKQINRAIKLLTEQGLAIALMCRNDKARRDGKAACGQIMRTEKPGQPDGGYGCSCSRIVFHGGTGKVLPVIG